MWGAKNWDGVWPGTVLEFAVKAQKIMWEININRGDDVYVEGGYVDNRSPTIRSNRFCLVFMHVQNRRGGC